MRDSNQTASGKPGTLQSLIAESRDVRASVAAWRSAKVDRFDFSIGNVRLDVKASSDRMRVHHLSAEQCQPPDGTVGLLASLFIESSGGGLSLRELVAEIEAGLAGNDNLILKVQETIVETLGESLPSAMNVRFDDRLALASLQFYDLAMVPAVRDNVPSEVSSIHFRSDLSRTKTLDESAIRAMSQLAPLFTPKRAGNCH